MSIQQETQSHENRAGVSEALSVDRNLTEREEIEFYTDGVGRTQLRKNSSLGELQDLEQYVKPIYDLQKHTVCICDTDMVYCEISGDFKTYIGKHITKGLYDEIQKKQPIHIKKEEGLNFISITNDENISELVEQYICPIDFSGTIIGAVIVVTKVSETYTEKQITEVEKALARTAAEAIASKVYLI